MVTRFNKVLHFEDLHDLISLLLYVELIRVKKIKLSTNNVKVLALFSNNSNKKEVIEESLNRKYINSIQTGENVVSKFVKMGLVTKLDNGRRELASWVLGGKIEEMIIATLTLHNVQR